MISIAEATQRILAHAAAPQAESVPLMDALDRVCAVDVIASSPVPPWDNSAMDGFAVRAADTGPRRITEVIGAGSLGSSVEAGTAAAVMTGAPIPDGADAVVMVENTEEADGFVTLQRSTTVGANIRRAGNDIAVGDRVVHAGVMLTPGMLGALASVGRAEVEVARRPRVAVLSTGDELVRPGTTPGPAQIYSSNPIALCAAVRRAGGVPVDLGEAPDDLDTLVALMKEGLQADALVTTGGVSVGRFDLVKPAFAALGIEMDFWKVKMKPGKPLAFGVGRVPVFGLPGNPVSCQVNFQMFVRPWIRACLGDHSDAPTVRAVSLEHMPERPGRAKLLRVTLERTEDGWGARSTGTQSSGAGSSMARAHGLLVRSPEEGPVEIGEIVEVRVLETSFLS